MLDKSSVAAAKRAIEKLRREGDPEAAAAVDTLLRSASSPVAELDYYTTTEAGNLLRVTGQTIKNWVASGRLPGYRIGSRIVIPKCAVEEYVRRAGASLNLEDLPDDEAAEVVAEGRPTPFYAKRLDSSP
jgi:excisionase family DNA binding protein